MKSLSVRECRCMGGGILIMEGMVSPVRENGKIKTILHNTSRPPEWPIACRQSSLWIPPPQPVHYIRLLQQESITQSASSFLCASRDARMQRWIKKNENINSTIRLLGSACGSWQALQTELSLQEKKRKKKAMREQINTKEKKKEKCFKQWRHRAVKKKV